MRHSKIRYLSRVTVGKLFIPQQPVSQVGTLISRLNCFVDNQLNTDMLYTLKILTYASFAGCGPSDVGVFYLDTYNLK